MGKVVNTVTVSRFTRKDGGTFHIEKTEAGQYTFYNETTHTLAELTPDQIIKMMGEMIERC